MSLPNLITIGRILLVPLTIWLIVSGEYLLAFLAFIIAGISDGVDGFIAKRYDLKTQLGAYLDPLADKLLLVSIYVSLGLLHVMPAWLVRGPFRFWLSVVAADPDRRRAVRELLELEAETRRQLDVADRYCDQP